MIWLTQKAHYIFQDFYSAEMDELQRELSRYLVKNDSFFSITVLFEGKEFDLRLSPGGDSNIELTYTDEEAAKRMWSKDSPANLILFVDASKEFSDETLTFDSVDITGNDSRSLLMMAILNPGKLFSGIYQQLVKDWAHERLIPGADRLFYFQVAGRLFNRLIPKVALSNFSSSHTPREFVLLGKSLQAGPSSRYDVREFSSGEKALLSTLTFLCLSKSVSVFLIDEPENHFHESLLLQFVSLLNELCQENGFVTVVSKLPSPKRIGTSKGKESKATKSEEPSGYLSKTQLEKVYGGTALSQVILSTHSKSLIYKIFTLGQNFLVERSVEKLEYKDAEATLREIGLSTTFSKVLLVEGVGDNEALESLFSADNIKVKAMDGSSAVIDSFRRLAALEDHIHESRFVFLVDSDNKPKEYFEKLESSYPDFYKKTFIKLPAHELENLFLDPKLLAEIVSSYANLIGNDSDKFTVEYVSSLIKDCAQESLPTVYKKEISLQFMQSIEQHFSKIIWGNKKFAWDDAVVVESQIKTSLTNAANESLNLTLIKKSGEIFEIYKHIDDDFLIKRCDGKQTLGKVCHRLGQESGMPSTDLKKALYKHARESKNSSVGELVAEIRARLQ